MSPSNWAARDIKWSPLGLNILVLKEMNQANAKILVAHRSDVNSRKKLQVTRSTQYSGGYNFHFNGENLVYFLLNRHFKTRKLSRF